MNPTLSLHPLPSRLLDLQKRACDANHLLHQNHLAILTWGNASEVDRESGVFAIKPSGVEYDDLTPESIPLISLETGKQVAGELNPSSDTQTHLHLYRAFPEIGGVVHTHSPNATAWAQARQPIPCLGTTHADTFHGTIPCTRALNTEEVESDYEQNTGLVITEHFQEHGLSPGEIPGVLVSAHAPFTWGASAKQAVLHAEILEEVAKMAQVTRTVFPNGPVAEDWLQEKHYRRKHGAEATYGQTVPAIQNTASGEVTPEVWFITGSQHLYGPGPLKTVQANSNTVAEGLASKGALPFPLIPRPIVTTAEEITRVCREANSSPSCVGLVFWMHTFSPARMWIQGLKELQKPFLHLHTQFHQDIPWSTLDMEFMNLNQSAHGDREFGYMCTRLGKPRKVVAGHWQDTAVQQRLGDWMRVAHAWNDQQHLLVARLGDNMRNVAVTEGDKTDAQIRFGYTVNGYGIGEIASRLDAQSAEQIHALCSEYDKAYTLQPELQHNGSRRGELEEAARIELALRSFLEETGARAFTDTFEDLQGMRQLPGLAVQRLMAEGYGFGAEGDWKHAALVRALKVMGDGKGGGTSFMEDYTYHLQPGNGCVLGAHMLEVCPSISSDIPRCELHPLGIGGREDPVRLIFTARAGTALNATIVDTGSGFRMIVNPAEVHSPPEDLPELPVARALWTPAPTLQTAAEEWIQAGGAHHTAFSYDVTPEQLEDFAKLAGIDYHLIC